MSRVVAARENISAGVFGFGWGWVEVDWVDWDWGLVEDCVRDWVDLEWWRVEGGFGERVFEVGWGFGVKVGVVGVVGVFEEDVEDEVIDGVGRVFFVLRDKKEEMRCFLCWGDVAVVSVWVEEAAEDSEDEEDDEKAKEKRDGEPGKPMRTTVLLEPAESGLAWSGEAGLSFSFNGASASRAGRCLRFVRPPEGSSVCAGCGFCWMTGAGGRDQRSGAE
jgi:hypothetical protein